MGSFYTIELDPTGRTHSGQDAYVEMHSIAFEIVEGMRKLTDAFAARLAESPLGFEHEFHQADFPPMTIRWRSLRGSAGMITVIYQGRVTAYMLLLPDGSAGKQAFAIGEFEAALRAARGPGAEVGESYNLARLTKRPLVVRMRWHEFEPGTMPLDLAEWCLAAAFFRQGQPAGGPASPRPR